jgi:hypothetical protein
MLVKINDEERYFDDTEKKWGEKISPIREKCYYASYIINIINVILYLIKFHDNILLLMALPFCQLVIITFADLIIRIITSMKGGDKKYIKTYYPELAKKLNIDYRNDFAWIAFINGKYVDYNKDIILDDIRVRRKEFMLSILRDFRIILFFLVISLLAIAIKAYLKYN